MLKRQKKILAGEVSAVSPEILQEAAKIILSELEEAEEKITELEKNFNSTNEDFLPRVKIIDETHRFFNGEVYSKLKNGYYGLNKTLHNAVYQFYHGLSKIPSGYVVHHAGQDESGNFDKEKNDIEYLVLMERGEHTKLHQPLELNRYKTFVCKVCGKTYQARNRGNNCFCSRKCKNFYKNRTYNYNEEKICNWCGKKFFASKYSDQKYCSYRCGMLARWTKGKSGRASASDVSL